jgi:hypothetical protein
LGLLLVGQVFVTSLAWAQDTTSRPVIPPVSPPVAVDTLHRLKPMPAFLHSLLIPGWAQAKLDRKLTASLFLGWEGLTLGMSLKAAGEVSYLNRIGADSARIASKKQERQDWLILLAFNHLFAGLEAFVGSHLQDFPADVRLRPVPRGIGVQASVPFRLP